MSKEEIKHEDLLGQPVKDGSYVAFPRKNRLYIGLVTKLTPKQLRIVPIKYKRIEHSGYLTYPDEVVVMSGPDALAYILKNV